MPAAIDAKATSRLCSNFRHSNHRPQQFISGFLVAPAAGWAATLAIIAPGAATAPADRPGRQHLPGDRGDVSGHRV